MGTFNGLDGESLTVKNVAAGEHVLVVKDFMENEVWTEGRLILDPGFALKLGVHEQNGVRAFNKSSAWRER